MSRTMFAVLLLSTAAVSSARGETTRVSDQTALLRALTSAKPGDRIEIAPGVYRGDLFISGLKGSEEKPIVIAAADPMKPPLFKGGGQAMHLSGTSFVRLENLDIEGMTGNGINIDDAGQKNHSSHHVVLKNLRIKDVGPRGNHDGIKLSGVTDFRVEGCLLERWGSGGSGIDMVGCMRGEIADGVFRHGDSVGDNGVQAKGGSRDILVRRCLFDHSGQRAVNIGGSTGLDYFRPKPQGYEAKDVVVEDCTFVGSQAPVAFVGVDGSIVRRNTIYRPRKWGLRILQENRAPGFVPSRNGRFENNLVVFRSNEMTVPANVGDGTSPESFVFEGNAWYCVDSPNRSKPRLPVAEKNGRYGVDPKLRDPENGDFGRPSDGPLGDVGAREKPAR